MADVEIYTQPYCPYCVRALKLLTAKGVAYRQIDAPQGSAERRTAAQRSGGKSSMPQIFIDGRHVGGCDDIVALDAKGGLDPLLQAA